MEAHQPYLDFRKLRGKSPQQVFKEDCVKKLQTNMLGKMFSVTRFTNTKPRVSLLKCLTLLFLLSHSMKIKKAREPQQ